MKYITSGLLAGLALTSGLMATAPQTAQAATKRTAYVRVQNRTGRNMKFVSVSHKYSNNYQEARTWLNLPHRYSTRKSDSLAVNYNTGAFTTGKDWWAASWVNSQNQFCQTSPNNFRKQIDALEQFTIRNWSTINKATQTVADFAAEQASKSGPKTAVIAQVASKAVPGAMRLIRSTINTTSTVGYKQHILRSSDANRTMTIQLLPHGQARITSRSGVSNTIYKCKNLPQKGRKGSQKRVNYRFEIKTSDRAGAGTDSNIYLTLDGTKGRIGPFKANSKISGNAFERNDREGFTLRNQKNIGRIKRIQVYSDGRWAGSNWHLSYIKVNGQTARFNRWLDKGSMSRNF
ncbi:hypothetical protein IQ266_08475 [filamentous cyanobacterium LEGE 11480]|uniref:PLAT domain-containing protein n=1 Tax=Romeriopsis navalis LEGE 11480 TaxID=2777977 RepID=A0A928VK10_9CYAN|nr:PLAT/LH2 domain-containing protein [Romeriopsis navalis]MBE9029760.1 hypothetical protein [Romeriopsis navalis LEGE 11480]